MSAGPVRLSFSRRHVGGTVFKSRYRAHHWFNVLDHFAREARSTTGVKCADFTTGQDTTIAAAGRKQRCRCAAKRNSRANRARPLRTPWYHPPAGVHSDSNASRHYLTSSSQTAFAGASVGTRGPARIPPQVLLHGGTCGRDQEWRLALEP